MIRTTRRLGAVLALLALGACAVAPPTGPMVLATPPQGKDLGRFQQEDGYCRNYAFGAIGGASPTQAAGNAAVGSAAVGTALGAAAGALVGSAGAAAGSGAAVGAGLGLLAGSAVGANNAQSSGVATQQAFDVAYAQCMTTQGNTVQAGVMPPAPGAVAYGTPYAAPGYVAPYYATPYAAPGYYGYPASGWGYYGYGVPSVTLGFGVYRGWGYRPWYHGRSWYGGGGWRGGAGGWHHHGRRR